MNPRYLSKSRFKQAHECPTKLFYTGKKEYANLNDENDFLKALAEGGYQVGELAKLYYPGGLEPNERDYQKAHEITTDLITKGIPAIYEASLVHKNLFARIDILSRISETAYDLIEVKSKSFDPADEEPFWNINAKKKGIKELKAKWEPYLYDVAYQTYIARLAFPHLKFNPFLLLANKGAHATVDGLNQLFPVTRSKSGSVIISAPSGITPEMLGEKILVKVDVSEIVEFILNESKNGKDGLYFSEYVENLAAMYENENKYPPLPSSDCKRCEYYADQTQRAEGLKSGFNECWKEAYKTTDEILDQDLVTDLWNFRGSNDYLRSNVFRLDQLPENAINIKESDKGGLSMSERQLLQLTKVKKGDMSLHVDLDALRNEMNSWVYPLHFIDFETMTVAIPFHKYQRPYESIAFQFSHHEMQKDGSYHHKSEYIYPEIGTFPNFEFVRALYKAIGASKGTILRYSPHENTILNQIHKQLDGSFEVDKLELMAFISSITQKKAKKSDASYAHKGERNMVDLWDLLKRFYYDPTTHGSNSLKDVFPAILRRSEFLQKKYSKPIYGGSGEIKSRNYKEKIWISKDGKGQIVNPYLTLPRIFEGLTFEESERLFAGDELREGGSASVAFARMQFEKMNEDERVAIREALLRYCELDTLAMVMLVEHWRELCGP